MLPGFIITAPNPFEGLFAPESAAAAAGAPSGGMPAFDSKAFDAALAETLALLDIAASLVPSAFAKAPADGDVAARRAPVTPAIPEWVADIDLAAAIELAAARPAKHDATTGELDEDAPIDETTAVVDLVIASPVILEPAIVLDRTVPSVPVVVETPPAIANDTESAKPSSPPPVKTWDKPQAPIAAAPQPAAERQTERPAAPGIAPVPAIAAAPAIDRPATPVIDRTAAPMVPEVPAAAASLERRAGLDAPSPLPGAPAAPSMPAVDQASIPAALPDAPAPAAKASDPVTTAAPALDRRVSSMAVPVAPVASSPVVDRPLGPVHIIEGRTPVIPGAQPPIAPPIAIEPGPAPIETAPQNGDQALTPSANAEGQTPDSEGRPSPQFLRFAAVLSQVAPPQDDAHTTAPVFSVAATSAAPATAAVAAAAPAAPLAAPDAPPDAENVGRLIQTMRVGMRTGAWEATVRLKPEHFGEVTIAMRVEGNTVTASVHAESAGVRQWLESQEQAVRSGLAEHGLQLDRFVVQRDGQQARRDSQQQEARRRQPRRPPQNGQRFEIVV